MRSVLADLVRLRSKDPRLTNAFLTFTEVIVASDLSNAKVGVSVMGDAEEKAEVMAALKSAAPFLQREMNRELHIRRIPTLLFHLDESMEQGDEMTQRLRGIARSEGRDL